MAKARTLTSQTSHAEERKVEQKAMPQPEKPQHDNQSEVSFRSEDFETSSRKGLAAVSGQLASMKIATVQPVQQSSSSQSMTPPMPKEVSYTSKPLKPDYSHFVASYS